MADDWILPPGTIKRQCSSCPREFASRNGALKCAYCTAVEVQHRWQKRKKERLAARLVPTVRVEIVGKVG